MPSDVGEQAPSVIAPRPRTIRLRYVAAVLVVIAGVVICMLSSLAGIFLTLSKTLSRMMAPTTLPYKSTTAR